MHCYRITLSITVHKMTCEVKTPPPPNYWIIKQEIHFKSKQTWIYVDFTEYWVLSAEIYIKHLPHSLPAKAETRQSAKSTHRSNSILSRLKSNVLQMFCQYKWMSENMFCVFHYNLITRTHNLQTFENPKKSLQNTIDWSILRSFKEFLY